ncbi:hypothetical protein Aph02nite_59390 [Actinoplanes philippinensis]|uniref:Uncharacterized protein n=1 Tax=Actinoplanes philippinensis TaxID=35752 RepID=A0A1I2JHG1_9ACTN|nr:hypothetical protein [Actinoplanes philippinensis]GIE79989.1 hypothetical protein Aph02nite_59390 [Actinoplanes philippinensis]SFF52617.1 hypothetical protein SAMN05421541_112149 [Actinoplanes philippinensis]
MHIDTGPAAEPLSGLRLVRARPWALAATVPLVFAIQLAPAFLLPALIGAPAPGGNPLRTLLQPLFVLIAELPSVVALTVVAVLAGRWVRAGRVLLLAVLGGCLWFVSVLVAGAAGSGDEASNTVVSFLVLAVKSILLGLAAGALFPAAGSGRRSGWLPAGSVALPLLTWVVGRIPIPWLPQVLAAALVVGWAVAALVTSRPVPPETAATPAELGLQDP